MGAVREVDAKYEDGGARPDVTVDGYVGQCRNGEVHRGSYQLPA